MTDVFNKKALKDSKTAHEIRMSMSSEEEYINGAPQRILTEEEIEENTKDFLTFNQKRELLWEEERKKRKAWEEDHLCEGEAGEVWFD